MITEIPSPKEEDWRNSNSHIDIANGLLVYLIDRSPGMIESRWWLGPYEDHPTVDWFYVADWQFKENNSISTEVIASIPSPLARPTMMCLATLLLKQLSSGFAEPTIRHAGKITVCSVYFSNHDRSGYWIRIIGDRLQESDLL